MFFFLCMTCIILVSSNAHHLVLEAACQFSGICCSSGSSLCSPVESFIHMVSFIYWCMPFFWVGLIPSFLHFSIKVLMHVIFSTLIEKWRNDGIRGSIQVSVWFWMCEWRFTMFLISLVPQQSALVNACLLTLPGSELCSFFFFLRVGGGLRLDYVRPFFWCLPSNCFLVYSKCFFLIAFYMAVNKKVAYLTKTSIKKKHRSATTLSTLFIRQLIK